MIDTIPALVWSASPESTTEFVSQHYLNYLGLSERPVEDWATLGQILTSVRYIPTTSPGWLLGGGPYWRPDNKGKRKRGCAGPTASIDGCCCGSIHCAMSKATSSNGTAWTRISTTANEPRPISPARASTESRMIVDTDFRFSSRLGQDGRNEASEQLLAMSRPDVKEFADWSATRVRFSPIDLAGHVETLTQSLDSGHPIDFETRLRTLRRRLSLVPASRPPGSGHRRTHRPLALPYDGRR